MLQAILGESIWVFLGLTVVLVGSSASRAIALPDGRRFAYTPRGYEKKFTE